MSNLKSFISRKVLRRRGVSPAREARVWSNEFIAQIAPRVEGRVVNVSAWKDEDKQGRSYRSYFTNAASYETTNYQGWRGEGVPSDHDVDLQRPAPEALQGAFDLVFNHTTLEHVFDFHRALDTLCEMSRDAVLVIVPWMQHLHGPEDGDFWRFSPYAMRRLLADRGFEIVAEQAGPKGGNVRYLGYLAARNVASWRARLGDLTNDAPGISGEAI